mgnify:CR=1 FL=1
MEYFKKAKINEVSLGIFSWSVLEPCEGTYNFGWMEDIINRLWENGISTILATPSGARPKWMADKYPEVLRVDADRHRNLFGGRHNHCYTSPVYRDKSASDEYGSVQKNSEGIRVSLAGICQMSMGENATVPFVRKNSADG